VAFEQQRTESQRLAGRPVDIGAGLDRLAAAFNEPVERAMQMKARRQRGDLVADLLELGDIDAGICLLYTSRCV